MIGKSLTLIASILFVAGLSALNLEAATLLVDSGGDTGAGTLRNQVAAASSGDTVRISPLVSTVTVTSADINLTQDIVIIGNGADLTTIDADGTHGIFFVNGAGITVRIEDLRMLEGIGSIALAGVVGGGAIVLQRGTLFVTNCEFENCQANQGGGGDFSYGGACIFYDNATLTDCTFTGNSVSGSNSRGGGAIYIDEFFRDLTVSISNCTFFNNSAAVNGGAIDIAGQFASNIINVSVTNCTFYNNTMSGNGLDINGFMNNGNATLLLHNNIFDRSSNNSTETCVVFNGGAGTYTSRGGNIFWKTPTNISPIGSDRSNQGFGDAGLTGTLALNGGTVRTIAISGGASNAVDLGTTGFSEPARDARDYNRQGTLDAGVFEYNGFFDFLALDPPDDATGLAVSTSLTISFAHTVTTASGNALVRRSTNNSVFASISMTGPSVTGEGTKSLAIDIPGSLEPATEYHVLVPGTTIEDAVGSTFAGINATTDWNFTTFIPPNTAPVVATSNTAVSTNEDITTRISVTVSDGESIFAALLMNATSSNQSLVPDGNIVQVGATSATTLFDITPANNTNGVVTITISADDGALTGSTTITLTINSVNDAPTFATGASVAVDEDSGPYNAAFATGIGAGGAGDESGQNLSFHIVYDNPSLLAAPPMVAVSNGNLSFTPAANTSGSMTVSISLSDDGGTANGGVNTTATQMFTITVNELNDAPTFSTGLSVTVAEDSGPYNAAFATSIDDGDPLATQNVTFHVLNNNTALFQLQSTIAASNGNLSFTPASNANGTAVVTVSLSDDGASGGANVNTSASQQFLIDITPVNDAPTFTTGASVAVDEDSGPYNAAFATGIGAGGAGDESGQNLSFHIVYDNPALLAAAPMVAVSNGNLSFTPAANTSGSMTVSISLSDDGGTTNGGVNTTATRMFTITVNELNDAPTFSTGVSVTVAEDSGPYNAGFATGIDDGDPQTTQNVTFHVLNNNTALFQLQPTIAASNGNLSFTPASNANGTAVVTVSLSDDGASGGGNVNTSASQQFLIEVTPVNDAPTFATGASVAVDEDSGPYNAAFATGIGAGGGGDESGQNLSFHIVYDNPALLAAAPMVAVSNGNLSFTPAAGTSGSITVSISLSDDGGTTNGGVNTSATQMFTITVSELNDAPTFSTGLSVTVAEDSGPYNAAFATGIDDGDPQAMQSVTFHVLNNNTALFQVQPTIAASNGNLSFTPASNANGTAVVTVSLSDDGASGGGNVNTSASQQFLIDVTPVNDAPTLSVTSTSLTTRENLTTVATLSVADIDTPFSGLTVGATSSNQSLLSDAGISLGATAATMSITMSPECGQSGMTLVTLTISDGEFVRATSFTLIVTTGAVLTLSGTTCACPGTALTYLAEPADPLAGHTWTISGGSILSGQGTASVKVAWDAGAAASLSVERTAPSGCSNSTGLSITAKNLLAVQDYHATSSSLNLAVLANDIGSGLTVESVGDPANGSSSVLNGIVTYTPDSGFSGLEHFDYTISDANACRVTGAIIVAVASTEASLANIEYIEREKDRVNGVRGLRTAYSVAITPDGRFVYAAGRNDHSIAIFERNTSSGSLSYQGRVRHGYGGVTGLKYVSDLAISPDGLQLYAAGYGNNSVLVFDINGLSGALSFVERISQGQTSGGQIVTQLKRPRGLVVSPDGRSVYVNAYASHTLAVFKRLANGRLEFLETRRDGVNGVDGLRNALDVAVSNDGESVYAAGYGDHALAVFTRSLTSGSLTYVERVKDGVNGVDGLLGAAAVAVSPDGRFVYAAGKLDNAVAVFRRNSSNGELTFLLRYKDNLNGVNGLAGVCALALSPDGRHLWAAGTKEDAVALFERDQATGELTWLEMIKDGVEGVDGLHKVQSLAVDPHSRHIYCAGTGDNAVAAFFRNRAPAALNDNAGSVPINNLLTIAPLDNDSDADGHSLTIKSVTGATLGATTISGGGTTIDYSAGAATGADSFAYTIDDGHGGESTATVHVNVVLPKRGAPAQAMPASIGALVRDLTISPNPVKDKLAIRFTLERKLRLQLAIIDLRGREVARAAGRMFSAGTQSLEWQPRLANGARLAAGNYRLVLTEDHGENVLYRMSLPFVVLR